jgi:hypothetical protein
MMLRLKVLCVVGVVLCSALGGCARNTVPVHRCPSPNRRMSPTVKTDPALFLSKINSEPILGLVADKTGNSFWMTGKEAKESGVSGSPADDDLLFDVEIFNVDEGMLFHSTKPSAHPLQVEKVRSSQLFRGWTPCDGARGLVGYKTVDSLTIYVRLLFRDGAPDMYGLRLTNKSPNHDVE